MVLQKVSYTLPVLKSLVESKNSCVFCIENCRRCFNSTPILMGNLKAAVNDHLSSKVATYDSQLCGIIMSHKNIRVLNSVQLGDDGDYRLEYIADVYIFKPSVGSILTGRVNKKSQDHLGVLIHSAFNATIPRPRSEAECPKSWFGGNVEIGGEVTLAVVKVNFSSKLPYIEGKLVDIEEKDSLDGGDSGIGAQESAEEDSSVKAPSSAEFSGVKYLKKKQSKKQSSDSAATSPHRPEAGGVSLAALQTSLLDEVLRSGGLLSPRAEPEAGPSTSFAAEAKSRKRKLSLFDASKELSEDPGLTSPQQKDAKRRKTSPDKENVTLSSRVSLESTIDHLINFEVDSLKSKKKKKKKSKKSGEDEYEEIHPEKMQSDDSSVKTKEKFNEGLISNLPPQAEELLLLARQEFTSPKFDKKLKKKKYRDNKFNSNGIELLSNKEIEEVTDNSSLFESEPVSDQKNKTSFENASASHEIGKLKSNDDLGHLSFEQEQQIVSEQSEKKIKKKKKKSRDNEFVTDDMNSELSEMVDVKKHDYSNDNVEKSSTDHIESILDLSSEKKKKKKKKSQDNITLTETSELSETVADETAELVKDYQSTFNQEELIIDQSNKKIKKKKKKSQDNDTLIETSKLIVSETAEIVQDYVIQSTFNQEESILDQSNIKIKKKKKKSQDSDTLIETSELSETVEIVKDNVKLSSLDQEESNFDQSVNKSKKKKKKFQDNDTLIETSELGETVADINRFSMQDDHNFLEKKEKKKKKKKDKLGISLVKTDKEVESESSLTDYILSSHRKRKSVSFQEPEISPPGPMEEGNTAPKSILKRDIDNPQQLNEIFTKCSAGGSEEPKEKKKKKKKKYSE